jgi:hypothetical protein
MKQPLPALPGADSAAEKLGGFITHGMGPFTVLALAFCLALLVHMIAKKIADKWSDRIF